jgi:prolyl oligopeptidase
MAAVRLAAILAFLLCMEPVAPALCMEATMSGGRSDYDPFSWLEDSRGAQALRWVSVQNERTLHELHADDRFRNFYEIALEAAKDTSHLPTVLPGYRGGAGQFYGGWVYEVAKDGTHPLGVLRRARYASFAQGRPRWESLLDLDEFSRNEGQQWELAIAASQFQPPVGRRCLLMFRIRDGRNLSIVREFDVETRRFIRDGFNLPESQFQSARWLDKDDVLVSSDFGPTGLMSKTGTPLPLVLKLWKRGELLASAKDVFRGQPDGLALQTYVFYDSQGRLQLALAQYADARFLDSYRIISRSGELRSATLPEKAGQLVVCGTELVMRLDRDWIVAGTTWSAGSLISVPIEQVGTSTPHPKLVMRPGPRERVGVITSTRSGLIVDGSDDLRGRLWRFRLEGNGWRRDDFALPDNGTVDINFVVADADKVVAIYQSFLQPTALYEVNMRTKAVRLMMSMPAQFDGSRFVTEQLFATSRDGEAIPYFIVRPRVLKGPGQTPTLMHDYGFLGGSNLPLYSPTLARLWLDNGGVYVLSNVRGNGIFGPRWEVSGDERQRTYDDFEAVARDLIRRNITSPRRLGMHGFSNGGLLVGVALTQHPELFHAAVLQAPLVDLLRGDLSRVKQRQLPLLYGTTELQRKTSPFQHLQKKTEFPVPLIMSATTDDVVPPAQPRRFAAKMESLEMPFLYYEAAEGGHGSGYAPETRAEFDAIFYTYLAERLM